MRRREVMPFEDILERRYYKRYLVAGEAEFRGLPMEIVNLGYNGMQGRCGETLPMGTVGRLTFTVRGYETQFRIAAEVIGTGTGVLSIRFLRVPSHMNYLIMWLVSENVPWSGLELAGKVQ
jgi:hypothetical protein